MFELTNRVSDILKDAVNAIPERYDRIYSRCKLASDPLYGAVSEVVEQAPNPSLPLMDIGCGMGLFAFYLRSRGYSEDFLGFDYDSRKTEAGCRVVEKLQLSGIKFHCGDARSGLPEHSGHVAILDILQYMTEDAQEALLREAAKRVAPGGVLVIRSGLAARSWRFRVTVWMDKVARIVNWMKEGPKHYPDEDTFRRVLEGAGLQVDCKPMWGKTPFHNYLITAQRAL